MKLLSIFKINSPKHMKRVARHRSYVAMQKHVWGSRRNYRRFGRKGGEFNGKDCF